MAAAIAGSDRVVQNRFTVCCSSGGSLERKLVKIGLSKIDPAHYYSNCALNGFLSPPPPPSPFSSVRFLRGRSFRAERFNDSSAHAIHYCCSRTPDIRVTRTQCYADRCTTIRCRIGTASIFNVPLPSTCMHLGSYVRIRSISGPLHYRQRNNATAKLVRYDDVQQ